VEKSEESRPPLFFEGVNFMHFFSKNHSKSLKMQISLKNINFSHFHLQKVLAWWGN